MMTFLLVALILLLLVLRQSLLVVLLAVAAFVHIVWGRGQLDYIIEDMWVALDKEVILSIPMFILCGAIMTKGSTAKRLIRIMAAITRPLPGGLGVACVLSCALLRRGDQSIAFGDANDFHLVESHAGRLWIVAENTTEATQYRMSMAGPYRGTASRPMAPVSGVSSSAVTQRPSIPRPMTPVMAPRGVARPAPRNRSQPPSCRRISSQSGLTGPPPW